MTPNDLPTELRARLAEDIEGLDRLRRDIAAWTERYEVTDDLVCAVLPKDERGDLEADPLDAVLGELPQTHARLNSALLDIDKAISNVEVPA